MLFFSFAHWTFVRVRVGVRVRCGVLIDHTVYAMFFIYFWVVLSCSVFVRKN